MPWPTRWSGAFSINSACRIPRAYRWRDDAAERASAKVKLESWRARALIECWLSDCFVSGRDTLRFELEDPRKRVSLARVIEQPFIFAIWHNRLLMLPSRFSIAVSPSRQSMRH